MTTAHHRASQAARWVRSGVESIAESLAALVRPRANRERQAHETGGFALTDALVDPPRIVLDGVFFQLQTTGIARLWTSLMAEWSRSGFADHVVVLDRDGTAPRFPGFTYRRMIPLRYHDSSLQRIALERVCRAERCDLLISTYYTVPTRTPTLMYVYDMIPEVMAFDPNVRQWREKRRAVEHASAYLAISQNTADDLERFYPSTRSRPIRVAHCAAQPVFRPATVDDVQELLGELDLPRNYFVFIGARDSGYKNASLVFDALAILPREDRPAVLFVGGSEKLEPEFAERSADTVVRLARLSDEQLATAYSGAAGLLYPSKYEGFGLPILEAMACGCPVVTCNNSSIPEVAGDAALYVGEEDPQGLADAMVLLGDPDVREVQRVKGFERVRLFDWRTTAATVEEFIAETVDANCTR